MANDLSFLSPTGFKLVLDSLLYPNSQFTVQAVALPDIMVPPTIIPTHLTQFGLSGSKIEYLPLTLSFLIDENLTNYREIHGWLENIVKNVDTPASEKTRDLTLLILNSSNNVSKSIKFIDAYPTNLGSLPFDITSTDIEYLTATVEFQYTYFEFVD